LATWPVVSLPQPAGGKASHLKIAVPVRRSKRRLNFNFKIFEKLMHNPLLNEVPFPGLFRALSHNVKLFLQQEMELAKKEMTEKISCYTRNVLALAIGGFVAYAGLIVLLGGLGLLLSLAFQKMGLDPLPAECAGLGAIGLFVILTGAAMILKGMKAIASGSLAPERTIETIKHLTGDQKDVRAESRKKVEKPEQSPEELEKEVLATEDRIGETIEEIIYRASPARAKDLAVKNIHAHPYTWSAFALGSGLVGGVLLSRRPGRGRQ
jgi:ElaB/YqjD/DUF883 family membrane-anchored ribosome-binding protein